jgi:hypothetical protein
VFDGKSINYFYIFFSRGRNIRVNRAVKALSSDLSWTGDILIVRGSARSEGVVNMRGDDRKLADFALKKYVFLVQFWDFFLIGLQGHSTFWIVNIYTSGPYFYQALLNNYGGIFLLQFYYYK